MARTTITPVVKRQNRRPVLMALVAAALGGGVYWYMHAQAAGAAAAAQAAKAGASMAVPVEVAAAVTGPLSETLEVAGQVQADTGVELRSEVTGRVVAVKAKDGEPVKKGSLLVVLDDSVQRATLAQAQANHELAQANVGRYQRLVAVGAASQLQVDQAVAEDKLQVANIQMAQANLAKFRIVAPFDGTAGIAQVNVGDLAQPGELLIALTDNNTLKVSFKVPETQATSLKVNAPVRVRSEAAPGVEGPTEVTGTIAALDGRVDPASRTLEGKILLDNHDGALVAGQFVRVRVPVRDVSDAVIVPDSALLPQGETIFAYLIVPGKDGGVVASRTTVTVGLRSANRAQIVSGITEGQQVVTAGQQKFRGLVTPVKLLSPTYIDVPPAAVEELQ